MLAKMKILVVLLHFLTCLVAQQTDLLKPCRMDDLECIRDTTQQFLEKTSKGIPQYGLKAIDPLEIEKFDYDLPEFGATYHVTNLKIVGLKNVQITDFQMDTVNKKVTIKLNISVADEGDIAVDYHVKPKPKTVTGHYIAHFKFLATTEYPYSVRNGDDGVMHYEVGREVNTFVLLEAPSYTLSKAFTDAVNADPQLMEARNHTLATKKTEFVHALSKELVDIVVSTLVSNLRQAAVLLPMSAFFKTD